MSMPMSEWQRYMERERRIQTLRLVASYVWAGVGMAVGLVIAWAALVALLTMGVPS